MAGASKSAYTKLYDLYKNNEAECLTMLFPGQFYRSWTLSHLITMARAVIPTLERLQRETIIIKFKVSIAARGQLSSLLPFAPPASKASHIGFVKALERIINYIREKLQLETDTRNDAVTQQAKALEVDVSIEEDKLTIDQINLLRFLDLIECLVVEAGKLWSRVALDSLDFKTAATLTSTYLCMIPSMVATEFVLNEPWFKEGCLIATCSGSSSYFNELQSCAPQINMYFHKVMDPIDQSKHPREFEPATTKILLRAEDAVKKYGDTIQIVQVPLVAVVVVTFLHRCDDMGLDLKKLRNSVKMRIMEANRLTLRVTRRFRQDNNFIDLFPELLQMNVWADMCCDAVSFGDKMCSLEINYIYMIRYYIHETSALQLFAYICERVRIDGRELAPALDALFDDPRFAPFLWLDGRPQTVQACHRAIEQWCNPESVRPVTQSVFDTRAKPTLTRLIKDCEGGVTNDMKKRLKGATLEDHLSAELKDIPDIFWYEEAMTRAASKLLGVDLHDTGCCYYYLREKVLYKPKLEKQLVEDFTKELTPALQEDLWLQFMKEWTPDLQQEVLEEFISGSAKARMEGIKKGRKITRNEARKQQHKHETTIKLTRNKRT